MVAFGVDPLDPESVTITLVGYGLTSNGIKVDDVVLLPLLCLVVIKGERVPVVARPGVDVVAWIFIIVIVWFTVSTLLLVVMVEIIPTAESLLLPVAKHH